MVVGVLTAANILRMGLDIAHISRYKQRRLSKPTKHRKFKSHYGVHPLHAARVWRDLLTTTIPAARINETDKSIYAFFAALNLVKVFTIFTLHLKPLGYSEEKSVIRNPHHRHPQIGHR